MTLGCSCNLMPWMRVAGPAKVASASGTAAMSWAGQTGRALAVVDALAVEMGRPAGVPDAAFDRPRDRLPGEFVDVGGHGIFVDSGGVLSKGRIAATP
jgi:hypothetical protein